MNVANYSPDETLEEYNQQVGSLINEDGTEYSSSAMPLISVIIPCYNQVHFLDEAIESVLRQTYSHVEIIVVDDGSTDNTAQISAKYPDVRCIRQENQGLSAARNTGLRESQGAFLVFLDADDRLLPNALEAGLQQLQANLECAFVSGHFRYINGDGSFRNEYPQESIDPDHYLALLQGNYIGMHATVMYRRAVFEAVGEFNTALPACEDYDLYLRIARQFPVARYNQVVAEYRQHHTNMSGNTGLMLKTVLAVLQAQIPAIETNPQQKKAYWAGIRFWQQYYGEKLFKQAITLWASGQRKHALQKLTTLVRLAPRYFFQRLYWQATQVILRILSPILPVSIRRLLAWCQGQAYYPPVGYAWLGDLRRLTPLSQEFGYDRGLPIDRYYIEKFLTHWTDDVRGRALEVGDDSYIRQFGEGRTTIHDVLHVVEGNPQATIVADLELADHHIPSNTFDCIILTQTLHLIYDIKTALQTLYRILKPGGVLLVTVPGISQISIDEWADSWYWAFTELAVRRLFGETFGEENIIVKAHGNVLAATAFLNGLAAEELHQAELEYYDPHYQLLITVRAVKPN